LSIDEKAFVHDSALVESAVTIGADSKIWHDAHVRTRAAIGARCVIGKGVFIDFDVVVGDDCKIQNYTCVYHGVTLARGVFVGPHVVFTNDLRPRATNPDFGLLGDGDWEVGLTTVNSGAAIGANSTIVAGVNIGAWAMIGAGAVVTRDVAPYSLVIGNPARHHAWVCRCGRKVEDARCERCGDLPSDHPLYQ
jgi:UDP-2-acetamido-3-amino-2,3-dideoxy-glucuronate N-acetyltransferase